MLMYMLGHYILVASVALSLLLGFLVTSRDLRSSMHRIYAFLTLSFIILSVSNFLSLEPSDLQAFFVRTVMFASTVGIYLLYLLIFSIKNPSRGALRRQIGLAAVTAVVAIFNYTPVIFSHIIAGSPPQPVAGPGVLMFFVHFLAVASLAAIELYNGMRHSHVKTRQQYKYILIGLLPVIILAPLTGFVLPLIYQQTNLIILTPLYTFIFLSFVGYAMVRHGLFDIKRAAMRSAAYIGVLGSLSVIYYFLAYALSFVLSHDGVRGDAQVDLTNVFIALALGFLFQPIKHFFDKLTNGFFYRESYDTDVFYGEMSRLLASTTDLHGLLDRAVSSITGTLKAEQGFFFIYRYDGHYTSVGTKKRTYLLMKDAAIVSDYIEQNGDDIIMLSALTPSLPIARLMRTHKLEIILPLSRSDSLVGYLCLGEHKGSGYVNRDRRVLETLADELVVAIQNALSVEEVKEVNATLQQRIDEATKELRASNAQLQRLDEAKDEFVSMASHQLRTPLTSVKGYLSMVLEGDVGKITEQQRHLLNEAFTSSERMVHLINDFLNVSRLQTGKFMLEQRPIDLSKITGQEVDSLKTTANARNLKLRYRKPSYFPTLYIDEGKIRQVIMNFIDNAIYYSSEFSTITISLELVDGSAILKVHNEGIGVPESEKAHLFTKFFRATNARKQRPDGTGVGLYLSKRVISAHGGGMVFDSAPSEGTTFGFRLPVKKLSSAPIEVAD